MALPFAAVLLASLAGGCSDDLAAIDRRTDALIRDRALSLGGSSRAVTITTPDGPRYPAPPGDRPPGWTTQPDPATVNPAGDELRFTPADEARDVAQRLDRYASVPADAPRLDLPGAWRQAQRTAREYLTAEEEYVLAALRVLIERHEFDPRLFATSTTSVTATGDDGNFTTPLRVLNELGVSQRLPDGGSLAARLVWDATEQLRQNATGRYVQASRVELSGTIPLLRGAGPVAREALVRAERELVYAARQFEDFRRGFLVAVARDYFSLAQQQAAIRNQERSLEGLLRLRDRTAALVAAGRVAEFEQNIAANRVLSATAALANLRERYNLALDRFKIRLGLPTEAPLVLEAIDIRLPEPEITPADAAAAALDLRLDLQTQRDRVDDARRAVANARNDILPDLDLAGSVTARTDPDAREGGFVYELDDFIYAGSVTFGLPLDRETQRLQLRQATIFLAQTQRALDRLRDDVAVSARAAVREIDRARFNLTLAEQAVQINRRRLEEQDLKRDELTAQEIVDTENDLLDAENARDQAVTDLRNAVLDYLLTTAQLRVARDGTLEDPLGPATNAPPEPEPEPAPPPTPPPAPPGETPAP